MSGRRVLLIGDTEFAPSSSVRGDSSLEVFSGSLSDATDGPPPDCVVLGELPESPVDALSTLRTHAIPVVVAAELDAAALNEAVLEGIAGYVPPDADDADGLLHAAVLDAIDGVHPRGEAERYLDRMTDAFFALDASFRFTYVNDYAAELLDVDQEAVIGELIWEEFPQARETQFQAQYEHAMSTGDPTTFEEYFEPLDRWFSVTAYPSESGLSVYFEDVTERVVRERELERRIRQQETLTELGRASVADTGTELDGLFADTAKRVADTLDSPCAFVLQAEDDGLTVRAAFGADAAGETVPAENGFAALLDGEVATGNLDAPDAPGAFGDVDAHLGVPIETDDVWGALVVCDTEDGAFDGMDTTFLQSVANLLASAVERAADKREIERQRDHLALLAEFDAVVQDIIGAVADSESRGEIERYVCERVVGANDIVFAWLGVADGPGQTIVPVASSDEHADYLDDITVTTDGAETAQGPAGRAAETDEVAVVNDIANDDDFEPWREAALERGFRSAAAIPLSYRDRLYGVLTIYAGHTDAFPAEVQQVLIRLGQNLANAMNALERRDAIITDLQTEVEFLVRDDDLFVAQAAAETGATIHLDGLVERSEGGYVAYLGVEDAEPEAVADIAPAGNVTEASVVRTDEDGGLVSIVLDDVALSNVLATHGAELVSITATPEGSRIVARLPRSVDTRTVVEAVSDAFDSVEFRAKRTREPTDGVGDHESPAIEFDLTDRQREALESALHAGYFDWPRQSTGEAVAESMGITAPTFQEHLRTAQQKILTQVLDAESEE